MSTNGSNGSTPTNETNGTVSRAWGLWAVGAAIPLSVAGLVLYWLRRRAAAVTADPYEEWWSARSRARENGGRPETHRSRPEGSNPLFV